MKLLSLFVRHGDAQYNDALEHLCQLYANIKDLDYDIFLIDTAEPTDLMVKLGPRVLMIGGDNSRREFSGWNTAITRFPDLLNNYNLVHIVTSAFENEYNGFYPYIDRDMLVYAARNPDVALAHVDAYPDAVRLFGRSFQTWGCSKFILAAPKRIGRMETFIGDFCVDDIFELSAASPFKPDAPLSANYRQHLLDWLTGKGLPHGQWHSVFKLSDENLRRFHGKAMSIIDEHSLSMRLRETGGRIVDYTWLHWRGFDVKPTLIPDELMQVEERNLFLFNNRIINPALDLKDYPEPNSFEALFKNGGDEPFSRSLIIDALWAGNRELQKYLDLNVPLHCAAIYLNQDVALDEKQRAWLAQADDSLPQDYILPYTRGLHALYLARDDLRASFGIRHFKGRRAMMRWWILEGRHDAKYAGLVDSSAYAQPDDAVVQDVYLPFTRGLHALHDARDDMKATIDLATHEGRRAMMRWWILEGRHDAKYAGLVSLEKQMRSFDRDGCYGEFCELHSLVLVLYDAREDLRNAFDIRTPEGRESLNVWFRMFGRQEFEVATRGLVEKGSTSVIDDSPLKGSWRKNGVNIIGFARGELGIGEDVRMASLALKQVDCDQCVPRISLSIGARQNDVTLRNYEVAYPLYKANLIFLPHYETIRLLGASGDAILGGRYNVGCWQWELPRYPKGLELTLDLVDEIWSSTQFTADAMRTVTKKPVLVMPMAVQLPKFSREYRRAEFRIPAKTFVFLTVLDGNSGLYRKNPLGVVQAFQKAFPRSARGVHLVLKTMNMSVPSRQWECVLKLCEGDPRISFISGTLPREEVAAMQSLSDCFVSLHRAEGFGRNIAEAMLLGKPVITSNFSGNIDFTNDATAFMVGGNTIPVEENQYSFAEGQYWFDADVTIAAEQMQRCIEDTAERSRRAMAGKEFVRTHYAPSTVGHRYYERLNALRLVH